MPARYDGRREETEEFAKMLQAALISTAFECVTTKRGITWELFREWVCSPSGVSKQATLAHAIANDMHSASLGALSPAYGADDDLKAIHGRSFLVPPRARDETTPSPQVPDQAPTNETGSSEEDTPVVNTTDEPAPSCAWACSVNEKGARLHLLNKDTDSTMCRSSSAYLPRMPFDTGDCLIDALALGKRICKPCFKASSATVQLFIANEGRAP